MARSRSRIRRCALAVLISASSSPAFTTSSASEPRSSALAGDSGGRRQTALYFALRVNGQPRDPRPWLVAGG